MESIKGEFQSAMNSVGLFCSESLIADGELHRFRHKEDAKPNSWYVLFASPTPLGVFGCWKRGIKQKWLSAECKSLQGNDLHVIQRCLHDAKEKYKLNQAKIHEDARRRAEHIWERSEAMDNEHDYLCKKQINGYGIRYYN